MTAAKERLQQARERYLATREAKLVAERMETQALVELSDATKAWEQWFFANGGELRG